MRQVVLDTETTGLKTSEAHRIIEIGCYELTERRATGRTLHHYINPQRDIDEGAQRVHGISREMLAHKPAFADIAAELLEFLAGAELVIHNADFDVGFINFELNLLRQSQPAVLRGVALPERIEDVCGVLDTLAVARRLHAAGNSLDALCKRYGIDNSARTLHGAMLDAEILAEVYLAMTGGQTALLFATEDGGTQAPGGDSAATATTRPLAPLRVIRASETELASHDERLAAVDAASGGQCIWLKSPSAG